MTGDFVRIRGRGGMEILRSAQFEREGFIAAFTTRKGGWSPPPFDGANMGYGVPDDPVNVTANRECALHLLGLDPAYAYSMRQVHGISIAEAGAKHEGDYGNMAAGGFERTDGMFTGRAKAALLGMFADCVPIILADTAGGRIGVVHAGWRGTAAGASMELASRMGLNSANSSGFIAAVGPSIGPCCYEVGSEVADAVAMKSGHGCVKQRDGMVFLDLGLANELQLMGLGIGRDRISRYAGCTSCEPEDFFSHRRDKGSTGRNAVIAASVRE